MNTSGHQSGTPTRWREEEDKILRTYVKQYTDLGCAIDWSCVAEKLPRRTNKDCRKRWVNHLCGGLRKGPWEADEDMMLRSAVAHHGQKWTLVASEVGSRSPDQCAKRWQHNLDPRLDHQRWTPKEDELLLESVERYGREWRKIQEKHYSTRSANDLKNRFTILSKKIRSRASSRSGLGPGLGQPSSSSAIVLAEEQDQESTTPSTDSGPISRPNWSVSPETSIGGRVEMDEIMQSTAGAQQQMEHRMGWGQQMRQEQHVQLHEKATTLLPLGHDDTPMTIDDLGHAPPNPTLPWTTNTTSPSTIGPHPFTDRDFTSLTTLLHQPYHHSQTDTSNSNRLGNASGHTADSNLESLVLGFNTTHSIPDGMTDGHLHSLLLQRVKSLDQCSPGGSVSLQGEGCDREVLNYMLDVLTPIRHLVKIEINM